MYKINYSTKAKNSLREIVLYIVNESASLEIANNVVSKIKQRINNRLDTYPFSGQVETIINGVEYRKIVVGRYIIIYKILEDDDIVLITNIIHETINRIDLVQR